MDFFNQGIPLGRWWGITVVIHWTFLLYALRELSSAPEGEAGFYALWLFLLFGTVLMHEFGHALACLTVGGEALHIVLWPLGGLAFVQPPNNPRAWLITTVCGPLVNAILWPLFWLATYYGMPWLEHYVHGPTYEFIYDTCWIMAHINKGLLFFNLIPAYPMDGGRILQELLWFAIGYRRSLQVAGMVGTVAGVGFIVLGLGLHQIKIPIADLSLGAEPGAMDWQLIVIGLLSAMMSFGIYQRSLEIASWRKN